MNNNLKRDEINQEEVPLNHYNTVNTNITQEIPTDIVGHKVYSKYSKYKYA